MTWPDEMGEEGAESPSGPWQSCGQSRRGRGRVNLTLQALESIQSMMRILYCICSRGVIPKIEL